MMIARPLEPASLPPLACPPADSLLPTWEAALWEETGEQSKGRSAAFAFDALDEARDGRVLHLDHHRLAGPDVLGLEREALRLQSELALAAIVVTAGLASSRLA